MIIYSQEAEQAVIGGILRDSSSLEPVMEILVSDDFHMDSHRQIYQAMLSIDPSELDALTLIDGLERAGELERAGGHGYVLELAMNTPSAANIRAYARIVKDKSRRRQVANAMQQLADMAATSDEPVDSIAAMAAAQIGAIQTANRLCLVRDVDDILTEMVQDVDKRHRASDEIDGLPTGIKTLDNRYLGWKPGDLVVMAGRPSMGKSALAFQIALNSALNKTKVVIFSLEMTGKKIMERMAANAGNFLLDHVRNPKSADGEFWPRLSAAVGRIKGAPLKIDETPGLHVHQICARARAEHRKSPVGLVVVDHINITAGDGQSREREVACITGALKGLAKELGCPVLALSQLNRKVEERANKRPLMSDLRDSGSIEQDADIIILLYRDEYYNPDTENKGVIEVITGKFREGEVGTDCCAAILSKAKITDLSPDYKMAEPQKPKSFEY